MATSGDHNLAVDTGIPAQGWRQISRSGSGATVESGAVTLHVIQGPDRTWQVDSGNRCP
jgi:hypothetical protein